MARAVLMVLCILGVNTVCLCEMSAVNDAVAEKRCRVEACCWLVHAAALQIYLYRLGFLPREISCTAAYFLSFELGFVRLAVYCVSAESILCTERETLCHQDRANWCWRVVRRGEKRGEVFGGGIRSLVVVVVVVVVEVE